MTINSSMSLYVTTQAGVRIEVAEADLPEVMNWDDAEAACNALGSGWRLPTEAELRAMDEQLFKEQLGGLIHRESYWAAGENTCGIFGDSFLFYHGYEPDTRWELKRVRPVRDVPCA